MECNKDEAERAKVIAETKLSSKDYSGAKKFALKAKSLYPDLDGISQMLTILDVYTCAENKVHGEGDWYGVLGVNPSADDETIKRAYRKLVFILHPDKNKSVGADGAFQYVCEAWSLLSDKDKRTAYNQERNIEGVPGKPSFQTGVPSAPFRSNDFHKFAGRSTTNSKVNQSSPRQHGVKVSAQKNDTFWTICSDCKMHFEYLKKYLNQKLLCSNCKVPFFAMERNAPQMPMPKHMSSNQHARSSFQNNANDRTVSSERDSGPGKRTGSSNFNSAQMKKPRHDLYFGVQNYVGNHYPHHVAANHQSMDRERRLSNEAQPAARSETRNVQTRLSSDCSSFFHTPYSDATARHESHIKGRTGLNNFTSVYGARALLIKKATSQIQKQLKEWSLAAETKTADRFNLKTKDGQKETPQIINGNDSKDPTKINGSSTENKEPQEDTPESVDDAEQSMTAPDPDFHNFDMDRTERSFGEKDVWASYDNDDGMPRYYAFVHKVINTSPFKLKISWLNSKSTSEFGSSNWVDCGFSKTCGIFRIGRHETNSSLNSFSHKVEWTRVRGAVQIYPQKGDVWALYKNWSSDWDENTPKEIIHKYEMVELLDDYNDEQGISMVPLVKVSGFRTVFRPEADPNAVKRIPREEMLRFSHQVPHYVITGKEAENAPKGFRELDPAATPIEFLQVLCESNETGATSFVDNNCIAQEQD